MKCSMKPAPAQETLNKSNQGHNKDKCIIRTIIKLWGKRTKPYYSQNKPKDSI